MTVVISEQTRSIVTVIDSSPQRLVIRSPGIQGEPGEAIGNVDGGTASSVYGGIDPIDGEGA